MKEKYRKCVGLYHRLGVNEGLQNISLEEWERLGEVRTHTVAYLGDEEVSRDLDEIVKALTEESGYTYTLGQPGL